MFQINGEWWHIYFVQPYDEHLQRSDGSYTVGVCDDTDKAIYLNDTLYGNFFRKVLCHEITHAAMFSYDVILTLEQEELLADIIATYGAEIIEITNLLFKKITGIAF